jgi:hypothetical protein
MSKENTTPSGAEQSHNTEWRGGVTHHRVARSYTTPSGAEESHNTEWRGGVAQHRVARRSYTTLSGAELHITEWRGVTQHRVARRSYTTLSGAEELPWFVVQFCALAKKWYGYVANLTHTHARACAETFTVSLGMRLWPHVCVTVFGWIWCWDICGVSQQGTRVVLEVRDVFGSSVWCLHHCIGSLPWG